MIPVSVVIFTKNEEANITACIESARGFGEVFVVDSNSTDMTVELAEGQGARIIQFFWDGKIPKKRQWSLESLPFSFEWILMLDADERLSSELANEIGELVAHANATVVAVEIVLDYYFGGKQLRFGHKMAKRVLLRHARCRFPDVGDLGAPGMGELEGHFQPIADGSVARLKNKLTHDDRDELWSWAERHVRYARWDAFLINDPVARERVMRLKGRGGRMFHNLPSRPLVFFLYSYVIRFGFLDGRAGFDYAFGLAWYYWLAGVIAKEELDHS